MSLIGGPGTLRAVKDKNVIMRIDGDARDLTEDHAVRKNGPAMNDGVWFGRLLLGRCGDGGDSRRQSERYKGSARNQHGRTSSSASQSCGAHVCGLAAEIISAKREQKSSDCEAQSPGAADRLEESMPKKKRPRARRHARTLAEQFAGRVYP